MEYTINLFGDVVPKRQPKSAYQLFKEKNKYRESETETRACKNCGHHQAFKPNLKIYHKCALMGVSRSEATDTRLKMVCDGWEQEL